LHNTKTKLFYKKCPINLIKLNQQRQNMICTCIHNKLQFLVSNDDKKKIQKSQLLQTERTTDYELVVHFSFVGRGLVKKMAEGRTNGNGQYHLKMSGKGLYHRKMSYYSLLKSPLVSSEGDQGTIVKTCLKLILNND
jgi:hypothetical protein